MEACGALEKGTQIVAGDRLGGGRGEREGRVNDRRRLRLAVTKRCSREGILRAGLEHIIEHGLDAELDDICRRAGCTRRSFRAYFKTRQDLVLGLTLSVVGAMLDWLVAAARETDDLTAVVAGFPEVLASGKWPFISGIGMGAVRLMEAMERWPGIRQHFSKLVAQATGELTRTVAEAQKAGRIRADIGAKQVATLLVFNAAGTMLLHDAGVRMNADRQRALLLALLSR